MNYNNQTCPHCGKLFADGDDVVVCPVCATPQHRECWMQAGHCANDSLHSSGFVWQKETTVTANPQPEPDCETIPSDTAVCHICGSENPAESLHCGNCGALIGESDNPDDKKCNFCGTQNDSDAKHCKNCGSPLGMQKGFFTNSPYLAGTGIDPNENIGGNSADDLALYVQASAKSYLPKFKRFSKGKKLSFNFAAFFFAPYWFFYRKLYKAGAFFLVLFVTSALVLSAPSEKLMDAAEEYTAVYNSFNFETATEEELAEFEKELTKAAEKMMAKSRNPMLIVAGVTLTLRLLAALLADWLYYKKILKDMKIINDSVRDENMRKMTVARRGGLAPLSFAASLFGYNSLVSILVYAAESIMNNF